uniref:LysR family transcriptional regulator n=1 Tax=Thaumasiovibrio occultus TaxID=1891184 RepID=UPI000B356527|nr:LysR family transcriptional regulator [Thaumasiovibrio occultus]
MLLEGIETLLVLGREGTMSRTGSQLYISQSAVSKRIANLEKKLGKKLIEPQGRYIRLTADGQALIASIGPSFNELRGLIFEQQEFEDDTLIRLDCSETLIAGYLGEVLGAYCQQDRHLTITTNHTPRIVEHVQSGKATLGCCAGYLPPQHGLMTFHVMDEKFYIVSKHSLNAMPERIITNDLSNPANTYQIQLLEALGSRAAMEMDSYTAAARLALGGAMPALVPLSVIRTLGIAPEHCFYFEGMDALFRPIYICVRQTAYRYPRIKTLIAAIVDAVPKAASVPLTSTS